MCLPVANASFIEEDILPWRPMKALDFLLFVALNVFLRFFICDIVIYDINRCLLNRPGFDYKSPV